MKLIVTDKLNRRLISAYNVNAQGKLMVKGTQPNAKWVTVGKLYRDATGDVVTATIDSKRNTVTVHLKAKPKTAGERQAAKRQRVSDEKADLLYRFEVMRDTFNDEIETMAIAIWDATPAGGKIMLPKYGVPAECKRKAKRLWFEQHDGQNIIEGMTAEEFSHLSFRSHANKMIAGRLFHAVWREAYDFIDNYKFPPSMTNPQIPESVIEHIKELKENDQDDDESPAERKARRRRRFGDY